MSNDSLQFEILEKHWLYPAKLKDRLCRDMKPGNDYERAVNAMQEYAEAYATQQNRELLAWKESAMKILSAVDNQEIGKLLGVPLGHSISENLLEKIREYGDQRAKKALEKAQELVSVAYQANNHARQMINKYAPKDQQEINYAKVDKRSNFLSENYADNTEPKIIQSYKSNQS